MVNSATMPRQRITLYLDDEIFLLVKELASKEVRSVPNCAEALVIEALRGKGLIKEPTINPVYEGSNLPTSGTDKPEQE